MKDMLIKPYSPRTPAERAVLKTFSAAFGRDPNDSDSLIMAALARAYLDGGLAVIQAVRMDLHKENIQ